MHAGCAAQANADIKNNLQTEVRHCSDLIIWTDCDREGENIGNEVIAVCREVNPRVRTHRAIFASINPQYGRAAAALVARGGGGRLT